MLKKIINLFSGGLNKTREQWKDGDSPGLEKNYIIPLKSLRKDRFK